MRVDALIIGQGLAGTTLAWHLLRAGLTVRIVDRNRPGSSSQIAAGLLTPITGQRLAKSWRVEELFPVAQEFYQALEQELGVTFFQPRRMVRIFQNDDERRTYQERADNTFAGWVCEPTPPLNPEWFVLPRGAFEMPRAAQLNTTAYLSVSHASFLAEGILQEADLQLPQDLGWQGERISCPRLRLEAGRVIFCEGAEAGLNELFRFIRFQPAKGEILTVRIAGLREDRVIHHGVWLVPLGQERFRVGATFQRDRLDSQPTAAGRDELLAKLRSFVRLPIEVLAHDAAVRPVIDAGRPLLGTHPDDDRIGFFNGLGAKGSLLAPYFAAQLTRHLLGTGRIDPEVRLGLPAAHPATAPRLTQQAQQAVQTILRPGDLAIDATTGNGRDTRFLAELVGPSGTVYGLDLQQAALDRTREQLQSAGLHHVQLHCSDHAELRTVIAPEHHGQITAIMFNLGYLPGGDQELITRPERTIPAVAAALELLRPGGLCSIVSYVGHPGGLEEFQALQTYLRTLPVEQFDLQEPSDSGPATAPRLFLVRKRTARGNAH